MCTSSAGHELACPQGHMSDLYPRQMNVRSGVSTTHSVLSCLRLWLCRLRCKGPSYTYAQWCFENLLFAKFREWCFDLPFQMQGSQLHTCAVVFRKPIVCKTPRVVFRSAVSDARIRATHVRSGVSKTYCVQNSESGVSICRLRCKDPSYTCAQWCFENLLRAKSPHIVYKSIVTKRETV